MLGMQAMAKARFVRTSPRKARLVIDAIRGKDAAEALAILKFTPNRAARLIEKVLQSAIANGENNFHMNGDSLKVAVAMVDGGPMMKRVRYAPMGRGYRMVKRLSHITIIVEEVEPNPDKIAKRKPVAKSVKGPKTRAAAKKTTEDADKKGTSVDEKPKKSTAKADAPEAPKKRAPRKKSEVVKTAKAVEDTEVKKATEQVVETEVEAPVVEVDNAVVNPETVSETTLTEPTAGTVNDTSSDSEGGK